MGTIYSYVRVSGQDQNELRQIIAMEALGIPKENIFLDKQSGKNTARPGLQRLLKTVKKGDTVVVESVSRFARNTRDLLELVERLTKAGVEFISQKENIDTTTPTGKFMLTVFGGIAELDRLTILQRQREGIAAAKAQGVHLGRPIKAAPKDFNSIVDLWEKKQISIEEAQKRCGNISQSTFFRRLRETRNCGQKNALPISVPFDNKLSLRLFRQRKPPSAP